MKKLFRKIGVTTEVYTFSIIILILILFPIVWLFLTAVKPMSEVQQLPIHWLPRNPTFEIMKNTWIDKRGYTTEWVTYFINSIIVAGTTTFTTIILATLTGYALARFNFVGQFYIIILILIAQLIWGPVLLIPIYVIISRLGLYNTLSGLILVYIAFTLPFATWLSYGNFSSMPIELEEAALLDGCSQMGAFLRITLPLSKVNVTTVGLMAFLLIWSEYPFASILLESTSKLTVSVGLANFISAFNIYWNEMASASIIVALPLLVLLLSAQKYFVKGMLAGAIK